MLSLQAAFAVHFVLYVSLPQLYVLSLYYRDANWMHLHGRMDSSMGESLYPNMDMNDKTTRSLCFILMAFVLKSVVLVAAALYRRADSSFRTAVHIDTFLFHFLQPLILVAMTQHLDITHKGTIAFSAIHLALALMMAVATDGSSGGGGGKRKKTE
mmetsp:Transcript_36503/g.89171  ORF Transcript_36503/g.89171 Transcript_36503/m.89171 type:complete len:156 (+) Transcript_36503:118-585(+)|eukprot:CAMPEP_0198315070 /NCGR_PEP_ID=MMETSP1450-20131203/5473_1 /TAXON_ID=753684 ORGANISM="Madagascaria erythrocladiodes, Strain CCMP3234" /NCGR_SAMPLE_ID=MMETSP1450 /ASSEMBLY_ACC=CAM_ASM_001115 /LENGTH=155 /DNA_ID=CAMNT_0044018165 /DNA_START=91 /DNA_END=558 /DNA_ORIENTATION=-